MVYSNFSNVKIRGISVAVPKNAEDNFVRAEELHLQNTEQFIDVVGVRQRHVAIDGQTASDLCFEAASSLLEKFDIDKNSIDALLFVTQTPDYIQPATACVLHGRLGLPKSTMAFDINLGCSGFVYGLTMASTMITGMGAKRVLLLVGDILRKNKEVDIKDTLLFGDVGTATIVEQSTGSNIESILYTDGTRYKSLIVPGGGTRRTLADGESYWAITKPEMDGESVMSFTITEVPKAFKELFSHNQKTINDYDFCVLHQANKQMITYISKKLKVLEDKLPISMDRFGNTNGSSILVTLADRCSKLQENMPLNIIASGFGIGLSWGVVTFSINSGDILPIQYTDVKFEEAYCGNF